MQPLKDFLSNNSLGSNYEKLGAGFFNKTYLSYDKTNGWGIKKLNLFERIARKVFGFYKTTHLKNVVNQIKIERESELPEKFMQKMKLVSKIIQPIVNNPKKSEIQMTNETKKFYTQNSMGMAVSHDLCVNPYQFLQEGIVCLPNKTAHCGLISILQIFCKKDEDANLDNSFKPIKTFVSKIYAGENKPTKTNLESLQSQIESLAEQIGDVSDPTFLLESFGIADQYNFGREEVAPVLDFEESELGAEIREGDGLISSDDLSSVLNRGEYQLIGIVSSVPGGRALVFANS